MNGVCRREASRPEGALCSSLSQLQGSYVGVSVLLSSPAMSQTRLCAFEALCPPPRPPSRGVRRYRDVRTDIQSPLFSYLETGHSGSPLLQRIEAYNTELDSKPPPMAGLSGS